jgi:hypothetical protein
MSSNSPQPVVSALVGLAFIGLFAWGLIYGLTRLGETTEAVVKAYHEPDTTMTITIHNGVPDTVITIIRK